MSTLRDIIDRQKKRKLGYKPKRGYLYIILFALIVVLVGFVVFMIVRVQPVQTVQPSVTVVPFAPSIVKRLNNT